MPRSAEALSSRRLERNGTGGYSGNAYRTRHRLLVFTSSRTERKGKETGVIARPRSWMSAQSLAGHVDNTRARWKKSKSEAGCRTRKETETTLTTGRERHGLPCERVGRGQGVGTGGLYASQVAGGGGGTMGLWSRPGSEVSWTRAHCRSPTLPPTRSGAEAQRPSGGNPPTPFGCLQAHCDLVIANRGGRRPMWGSTPCWSSSLALWCYRSVAAEVVHWWAGVGPRPDHPLARCLGRDALGRLKERSRPRRVLECTVRCDLVVSGKVVGRKSLRTTVRWSGCSGSEAASQLLRSST